MCKGARVKIKVLRGANHLKQLGFNPADFKQSTQGYAVCTIPWNSELNTLADHIGSMQNIIPDPTAYVCEIGGEEIYAWGVE